MWKYVALRRPSPSSDPSFRWAPFPEFQWRSFEGGITYYLTLQGRIQGFRGGNLSKVTELTEEILKQAPERGE